MRILLADDSGTMRLLIRRVLEGMGHASENILEATDGDEMVAALTESWPEIDLVVADWDLPNLERFQAARHLRNSGQADRVRMLFYINPQQRALVAEARASASRDFIERPFTDALLASKVRAMTSDIDDCKGWDASMVLRSIVSTVEAEAELPFLLQMPSCLIEGLLLLSTRKSFPAGSVLLEVGQVSEFLHFVTEGEVELCDPSGILPRRVCGEGDCFGEISFLTSHPSAATARARTPVQLAMLSKARLAELVRRQPRMADYISILMSLHAKTLTAGKTTVDRTVFKGNLKSMSFADVVQLLNSTRKTGTLGFRQRTRFGGIYLVDGEVIHAWTEGEQGEAAFYEIARWNAAAFAFNAVPRKEERTLHEPTMMLLMEAMRREDEARQKASSPDALLTAG